MSRWGNYYMLPKNSTLTMNSTATQISKPSAWAFVLLTAFACAGVNTTAASLLGDLSCQAWTDLAYPRKKTWTNAFLAPLSLAHQGLERTKIYSVIWMNGCTTITTSVRIKGRCAAGAHRCNHWFTKRRHGTIKSPHWITEFDLTATSFKSGNCQIKSRLLNLRYQKKLPMA